jgi:cytochrome c-type biogenesis protein CcmH
MDLVLFLMFFLIALAAASFAIVPLLRQSQRPRRWYIAPVVAAVFVVLGGLTLYANVGAPGLALETIAPSEVGPGQEQNYAALVSKLALAMRERPNDPQGWVYLGQGYMAFGQMGESAKAYQRAVALTRAQRGDVPANLLSSYGVALSLAGGEVTPEAEEIFREALSLDPKNPDARYHLGMAHAQRGENEQAIALWEGLVADAPVEAPWRAEMFAQLAILKARSGAAPNPEDMVAGLAARLAQNPKDLNGWLMLIQSYGVLGQKEKAHQAWVDARTAFAGDESALTALEAKAREAEIE